MTDVTATDAPRITRDDIEAKFEELQRGVDDTAKASESTIRTAGIVAFVLLLLIVFLLGRRRGRQGRTVVEIRRV